MKNTIILLFFSCALWGQTKQQKTVAEFYKCRGADCAIFPDTYLDFPLLQNKFIPTHKQVDDAELLLKRKLKNINIDSGYQNQLGGPVIHKKLRHYKRQYYGYKDSKGHRILLINCVWSKDEFSEHWLDSYILVNDGGSYYWNIKVDLETGTLFDLEVNGNS